MCSRVPPWVWLVLAVVLLVLVVGIVFVRQPSESTTVKITYPPNNTGIDVAHPVLVRGTSRRISQKQVIWVVVYPPVTDRL